MKELKLAPLCSTPRPPIYCRGAAGGGRIIPFLAGLSDLKKMWLRASYCSSSSYHYTTAVGVGCRLRNKKGAGGAQHHQQQDHNSEERPTSDSYYFEVPLTTYYLQYYYYYYYEEW